SRRRHTRCYRDWSSDVCSPISLDLARDRHASYFARGVTGRWDVWNGPGFRDAVDWVSIEFPNLRAAFRWSCERQDADTAADIAADRKRVVEGQRGGRSVLREST